jgi:uncharacterized membrane protein
MTFHTVSRIGSLVLAAVLCLRHADNGGCGRGGGDEDEHEDEHEHEHEHEHGGTATGTACPATDAPTAQNFGTAFLQTYCLACHSASVTGTARQGATEGVNYDTLEDVRRQAALIDTHAAAGPNATNTEMPPAQRSQPSQQEREKLGQWLACGAP